MLRPGIELEHGALLGEKLGEPPRRLGVLQLARLRRELVTAASRRLAHADERLRAGRLDPCVGGPVHPRVDPRRERLAFGVVLG